MAKREYRPIEFVLYDGTCRHNIVGGVALRRLEACRRRQHDKNAAIDRRQQRWCVSGAAVVCRRLGLKIYNHIPLTFSTCPNGRLRSWQRCAAATVELTWMNRYKNYKRPETDITELNNRWHSVHATGDSGCSVHWCRRPKSHGASPPTKYTFDHTFHTDWSLFLRCLQLLCVAIQVNHRNWSISVQTLKLQKIIVFHRLSVLFNTCMIKTWIF